MALAVRFRSPPPDRLTLRLTYQACTEAACLPSVTRQFEIVSRGGDDVT